jgi:hypothetical protein
MHNRFEIFRDASEIKRTIRRARAPDHLMPVR